MTISTMKRIAIGACVVLAAAVPVALAADDAAMAQSAEALFTARVNALREASAKDAAAFAGFLSTSYQADGEAVRRAWRDVMAELPTTQICDFFAGANVLAGSVSRRHGMSAWHGVFGLYNPWWDAILVLRLNDELRIDRMVLLGGEAFRGEGIPSDPAAANSTVLPKAEPLSLSLRRAQSKTAAHFRELFPANGDVASARVPPRGVSRDLSAVKTRAALRQRLMRGFQTAGDMVSVAAKTLAVLRKADQRQFRRHFEDSSRAAFCDSFAKFPEDVREGFGLYGYVPADKGSLFVFLNPKFPAVYATVSFPAGRDTDPKAGEVAFEWFDLSMADNTLEVITPESIRK